MNAKQAEARDDASHCFVCGPLNPIGLKLKFRLEDGRCLGEFTSAPEHAGFDGVTHGGIVFAVMDDAMANWFFLQGARGFTAKSEIRYRAPLPVGVGVNIECEMTRHKGRLLRLGSVVRGQADNTVYAESEASFMLEPGSSVGS